jgi:hypothetical protein
MPEMQGYALRCPRCGALAECKVSGINQEGAQMQMALLWIGRLAGFLGALLVITSVLRRASGAYFLGSLQIGTVLQGGIAATILGCLAYLIVLVEFRHK